MARTTYDNVEVRIRRPTRFECADSSHRGDSRKDRLRIKFRPWISERMREAQRRSSSKAFVLSATDHEEIITERVALLELICRRRQFRCSAIATMPMPAGSSNPRLAASYLVLRVLWPAALSASYTQPPATP